MEMPDKRLYFEQPSCLPGRQPHYAEDKRGSDKIFLHGYGYGHRRYGYGGYEHPPLSLRNALSRKRHRSSGTNFDVIKQQKYLARTLLSLETAMANKNDFTPEEWTKVLESIIAAGIAVSAVDPSGLWGTLKEAAADTPSLAEAKRDPNSNELIKAAVADFENTDNGSILAMRERFAQAEPTNVYSVH